jgi:hypothetical protein
MAAPPSLLIPSVPLRRDDTSAEADWAAMVMLASWADGLGGCGAPWFDAGAGVARCACGEVLYRVTDPAAETAVAA